MYNRSYKERLFMEERLKRDIIQWDIKSWSKALDYWEHQIDWGKINNGLELGAREGGLSLWLALKGKSVICSDLLDVRDAAQPLHHRYDVKDFIKYQDIDATNIPYENNFDLIIFKSIIGGIGCHDNYENQQKTFKEIYKALKPGGKLLFAENLSASNIHQKLRKKYVNWGNSWRYVSIQEMKEFLQEFSSYELRTTGIIGTFGRSENQRNMLSTIDDFFLNKICPKDWHYISYGIAVK